MSERVRSWILFPPRGALGLTGSETAIAGRFQASRRQNGETEAQDQ